MDESDEKLINSIVNYLEFHRKPNWIDLHNLRIIKYGSALHIDAHLMVPCFFNVREAHDEIDD
ncbi:cation transporter dimerization domain-containing protein [Bacteroidetes bacterium endosymbiont of Geopemphigus sp.]|uniref:cation transporter dimerization domain-containing protein n=1 Tax=Bacteroidetes bacterium endosymbiont of Geopemphigus sp. TaxID=2047937 RepID=UPI000CCFEF17|nr:cation transporter dimerization domain-containing protein [Bacteroidetes bacterium endosymbiont of Geopemphigus sp.]